MSEKTEEKGLATVEFSSKEKQLIRDIYAKDANELEFDCYMALCRSRRLNPFAGQIFLLPIDGKQIPAVSIHGLATIASRTGNYAGATPVQFFDYDDKWVDVWDKDDPPRAARIGVYMKGEDRPTMAVATWKQSAKYKRDGGLRAIWKSYPADMLEKCALAKALRRAFPDDAGGLFIPEEFGHEGIENINHDPDPPQNQNQRTATAKAKSGYSDQETYPFGKHKGEKWCDLPPDFLEWVMSNVKDKQDIRERCAWEIDKRAGTVDEPENGNIEEADFADEPISTDDGDELRSLLVSIKAQRDIIGKDKFNSVCGAIAKKYGIKHLGEDNDIEALRQIDAALVAAINEEMGGGA